MISLGQKLLLGRDDRESSAIHYEDAPLSLGEGFDVGRGSR
jgi:hypothetical protein